LAKLVSVKQVNMHEAKTQLSRLVDDALAGEEVVIAKAGRPVAKLVAYEPPREPRKPGGWEGKVWISPDFDDWTEEDGEMWYGTPLFPD
jgi:prevent-host-death family protein